MEIDTSLMIACMRRRTIGFCLLGFCVCLPRILTASASVPKQDAHKFLKSDFRHSQPGTRLQLKSQAAALIGETAVDTLDILAIRVDFRADSITQTTGNGRFLLSPSTQYTIDPPPHNREYFEAQMLALKNYYANVSGGKLVVRYQVFPAASGDAYHLDQPMNYYAPGRRDPNSDRRLAELFQDSFKKAEADAGIVFSQFDSFILFHAGVGEDFSEQVNSTPNDISSAFLTLDDLRKNLGNGDPGYRGIAVRNGTFYIPDGVILPETQTREITGVGFVEFGLLGTAALMFGHQLGLPNLFNTDNGASGIGYWGLMDQGSNNFIGLLPAPPEAWSKVFLGWERPVVITKRDTTVSIAAALHANPDKIYKIPITDTEYFLIENRYRDVNGDRVAIGRDINGNRIEFHDFPRQEIIAGGQLGVITQIDEYDFGLPFAVEGNRVVPGSGILIWHVDEEVIRQNYASNRVNADINRRGIDLEEADGAQDIGRFYSLIDPGAGSENGVPEDAWWRSNPIITQFLRPGKTVEFGPTTMPSTAANSGAQTGIVITNFSDVRPVMSFSVRNAFAMPNFPQYAGGKPNTLPPLLADLTGDGKLDIVVATKAGEIFAWQTDGQKVIDNFDAATIVQPNGLPVSFSQATFAILGDSLFAPPVLVDLNNDGRAEILTAGKDGKLRAWQARDANFDGRADLFWEFDLGAPCRANIAVRADSGLIFCGTVNGDVRVLRFDGKLRKLNQIGRPVRGISLYDQNRFIVTFSSGYSFFKNDGSTFGLRQFDFAGDLFEAFSVTNLDNLAASELLIRDSGGQLYVFEGEDFSPARGFPVALTAQEKAGVAVGDINDDGRKEIVLVSKNQLRAYNLNGVLTENFPLQISTTPAAKTPYPITPIIADADGDGAQDVIVNGVDGNVYAYHGNGNPVSGFPFAMSGAGLGSLATADMDGDGKLELVGVSGNGYIHVWHLPASSNKADWPMYHHDAAQTSWNLTKDPTVIIEYTTLMPRQLVYNYPNPTEGNATTIRYRLNYDAQVQISIYDSAGDLVKELSGPGLAEADNEVVWNLNGIQSGIYLARVEAKGTRETSVAIIKIAVIK